MGKSQRTKGAEWEREIARWWQKMGWKDAKRNLNQYQERDGRDIKNTEPYCPQCKVGQHISLLEAYKEAKEAAGDKEIALVQFKYDREEPMVLMSLEDFAWLIK